MEEVEETPEEMLANVYRRRIQETAQHARERMESDEDESSSSYLLITTKVDIAEEVDIPDNAFPYMTSASELELPRAKTIGDFAFVGAMGLKELYLPEVLAVGNSSFRFCVSATTINAPKLVDIGNNAFEGCESARTINIPLAKTIGDEAFYGCSAVQDINMATATSIGKSAFEGCSSITQAIAPNATAIGGKAFKDCISLKHLAIRGNKNDELYPSLMQGCDKLRTISIISSTEIDNAFLQGCKDSLEYIEFKAMTQPRQGLFRGLTHLKCIVFSSMSKGDVQSIRQSLGIQDKCLVICDKDQGQFIIEPSPDNRTQMTFFDYETPPGDSDTRAITRVKAGSSVPEFILDDYSHELQSNVFKDNQTIERVVFAVLKNFKNTATEGEASASNVFKNCKNLKFASFPRIEGSGAFPSSGTIFTGCDNLKCVTFLSLAVQTLTAVRLGGLIRTLDLPSDCVIVFKDKIGTPAKILSDLSQTT